MGEDQHTVVKKLIQSKGETLTLTLVAEKRTKEFKL